MTCGFNVELINDQCETDLNKKHPSNLRSKAVIFIVVVFLATWFLLLKHNSNFMYNVIDSLTFLGIKHGKSLIT